jgi:quercetin dioxygenase-like cupin family protein
MSKCAAITKRVAAITALVSIAIPLAGTIAQTLSPSPVFEADTTTTAKNGAAQSVHVNVQSWGIAGQKNGAMHEIPLRGFYVAHLLSGAISTTIDGQTTEQAPGDYWTVKAGETMQVMVLGEFAVLETIAVAAQ